MLLYILFASREIDEFLRMVMQTNTSEDARYVQTASGEATNSPSLEIVAILEMRSILEYRNPIMRSLPEKHIDP